MDRDEQKDERVPFKTFRTEAVTFCPAIGELRSKHHILKNCKELCITGSGYVLKPGYPEGVRITIKQSPAFKTSMLVTITSKQLTLSPVYEMKE